MAFTKRSQSSRLAFQESSLAIVEDKRTLQQVFTRLDQFSAELLVAFEELKREQNALDVREKTFKNKQAAYEKQKELQAREKASPQTQLPSKAGIVPTDPAPLFSPETLKKWNISQEQRTDSSAGKDLPCPQMTDSWTEIESIDEPRLVSATGKTASQIEVPRETRQSQPTLVQKADGTPLPSLETLTSEIWASTSEANVAKVAPLEVLAQKSDSAKTDIDAVLGALGGGYGSGAIAIGSPEKKDTHVSARPESPARSLEASVDDIGISEFPEIHQEKYAARHQDPYAQRELEVERKEKAARERLEKRLQEEAAREAEEARKQAAEDEKKRAEENRIKEASVQATSPQSGQENPIVGLRIRNRLKQAESGVINEVLAVPGSFCIVRLENTSKVRAWPSSKFETLDGDPVVIKNTGTPQRSQLRCGYCSKIGACATRHDDGKVYCPPCWVSLYQWELAQEKR